MHLKTTRVHRSGKTYQYAQLVESFRREDGTPTQRVVANLGARTALEIENLRRALGASRAGRAVVVATCGEGRSGCEVLDNLAWLDVAVVIALLRRYGVDKILEDVLPREEAEVPDADVVLSLVAQRCVAPDSKIAATEWFGRTALPELLGLPFSRFNNTRIHRVLTGLEACEEALQARLASAISAHHGPFSLLFLDLTDTWFVGRGPSLAEYGKTKEGLYRRKIGIALLCDQAGDPLRWKVVEGRRHDSGPMTEMAWSLQSIDWARGVPLVLDRAMGATAHIEELLATGRPFVTALRRNEFDAYTNRVPSAFVADVPWNAPDAARQAAEAVEKAGMSRVSDDLYVLDLGVVTRAVPEAPAAPPVNATDKCRDRLAGVISIQAALDSGEAKNLAEAGRPHGLSAELACQGLRLLRLAPDIQESIASGGAATLSLQDILKLTRIADSEAQRVAYDAALVAARIKPDGRRSQKTGPLSAAPPPPPTPAAPPQLRAVVAFSPKLWVDQKKTSDKRLGEIRAWTRRKNEALREPHSRANASSACQAAHARLERDHFVDSFIVNVHTESVDGRQVHQLSVEPEPDAWRQRQRFHGFQMIIARPDETRPPADLVAVYRAKDGVEKDFQTIKSVLHLRPVRHRTDAKVRAHVTLCMLALLVERALDRVLDGKITGVAALDVLADVHLNRIRTSADTLPVYTITRPKPDHMEILRPLGLTSLVNDAEVTATLHAR